MKDFNLALTAIQSGHVTRAQLLDEAHAAAKELFVKEFSDSGELHAVLGLPVPPAVEAGQA